MNPISVLSWQMFGMTPVVWDQVMLDAIWGLEAGMRYLTAAREMSQTLRDESIRDASGAERKR